jgi:hypothetical protein
MKLIYIQWCDATHKNSWFTVDEAEDLADRENWLVEDVGWIVKETKEYICLCSKKMTENVDSIAQLGDIKKIPKTWIRKRKVLTN